MLPSNSMLRKFGTRIWLSLTTVVWGGGTINMCMAFAKNRTDFILCRLFLGAAESDPTPGALMLVSLWHPRAMITSRIALFYSAFAVGAVIGGPIASGITQNIGNPLFRPWEWYFFFIEGLLTAGFGLVMFIFLADYPDKIWILTKEEKARVAQYMEREQTEGGQRKINYKKLIYHARDPLIYISSNDIVLCKLWRWGYSVSESQAMQAAPGICGFIGILFAGRYTKWFGSHYVGSLFCSAWLIIGSAILLGTVNNSARIFALCCISFGAFGNLAVGSGWLMSNVGGLTRSAFGGAVDVILGGLGGLCTSYIYCNQDAPQYMFGHGMNMSAGLLSVLVINALYFIIRRRNRIKEEPPIDISWMTKDEIDDLETDHPNFRYVL